MTTPVDVLREAILAGSLRGTRGRPGDVIDRLSPEKRSVLRDLTSSAAARIRVGAVELDDAGAVRRRGVRALLVAFDRRLRPW